MSLRNRFSIALSEGSGTPPTLENRRLSFRDEASTTPVTSESWYLYARRRLVRRSLEMLGVEWGVTDGR